MNNPGQVLSAFLSVSFLVLFSGCIHLGSSLQKTRLFSAPSRFFHPVRNYDKEVIIKGIPFYPQSRNQCGPSSLASVFSFWGDETHPGDITEIYSPELDGTLIIDMERLSTRRGFSARTYNGSISDLQERLSIGHPLILFVDLGILNLKIGHYIVVYGYNHEDRYLVVNWGDEQGKILSYAYLQKIWKKTGFLTLLVSPDG